MGYIMAEGHKPARNFDKTNENTLYWTDGVKVYFMHHEIKGADIETFEQYPGSWAKDKKHCYSGDSALKGADVQSFKVLNFTYAKDNKNVWTLGGMIKDADANTFEVCDDGRKYNGKIYEKTPSMAGGIIYDSFAPCGYGKDKNSVYYYGFEGKPKIVKNASPETFVSLNDGCYGYDSKTVFYKTYKLNKANPKTWKKLKENYYYSKDKDVIYYVNRIITEANAATFEVLEKTEELFEPPQLAKDKHNYYRNDRIITKEELEDN
jgi:hypothetical protein